MSSNIAVMKSNYDQERRLCRFYSKMNFIF